MLITDLSKTKREALARKLKKLIEPEGADSKKLIKETQIRKFLETSEDHIEMKGISEVLSILNENYSEITVARLRSKIQKSVLWDASMCNLPLEELNYLLFKNDKNNLITLNSYKEFLKLASSTDAPNFITAQVSSIDIIHDSDSEFCTIVDLDSDENYVDDEILDFCEKNNYSLYTYDYCMGLRAKCRNISNITIFNKLNANLMEKYTPYKNGKNILLDADLLKNCSLQDILYTAQLIKANKFILTIEFVEQLEALKENTEHSSNIKEIVRFFLYDFYDENYSLYLPSCSFTNLQNFLEENNAMILSSDMNKCINYKIHFIPYRFVCNKERLLSIENKKALLAQSKSTEIRIDTSEDLNISNTVVSPANLNNATHVSATINYSKIPHYKPKANLVNIRELGVHEKIWVLDRNQKPRKANSKGEIKALVGYIVIHGKKISDTSYSLTAYRIVVNNGYFRTGVVLNSFEFEKDNLTMVNKEYLHYATAMKMLT